MRYIPLVFLLLIVNADCAFSLTRTYLDGPLETIRYRSFPNSMRERIFKPLATETYDLFKLLRHFPMYCDDVFPKLYNWFGTFSELQVAISTPSEFDPAPRNELKDLISNYLIEIRESIGSSSVLVASLTFEHRSDSKNALPKDTPRYLFPKIPIVITDTYSFSKPLLRIDANIGKNGQYYFVSYVVSFFAPKQFDLSGKSPDALNNLSLVFRKSKPYGKDNGNLKDSFSALSDILDVIFASFIEAYESSLK